jgi:hypothetical protein
MSTGITRTLALCFLIASVATLVGCVEPAANTGPGDAPTSSPAEEAYDPHDVPITEEQITQLREDTAEYPAAVAKVSELRDVIEKETAGGIPENPYECHQALDKADLVLQRLAEIARDSDVPKEHWEAVNVSANELRTLFERIHQRIDEQQEPNFAGVSGEIDKNLGVLEGIAAKLPTDA